MLYNIKNESLINLILKIEGPEREMFFEYFPIKKERFSMICLFHKMKAKDLKEKIKIREGLASDDYELYFKDYLLKNEQNLELFNIKDSQTFYISQPVKIQTAFFIDIENYTQLRICLYSNFENKLPDLAEKLRKIIDLEEDSSYVYKYGEEDKYVKDNELIQNGIYKRNIIKCKASKIIHSSLILHIKSYYDESTEAVIGLEPSDYISSIYSKLNSKWGIKKKSIKLFYNLIELEEHLLLKDYNISSGSIILMRNNDNYFSRTTF